MRYLFKYNELGKPQGRKSIEYRDFESFDEAMNDLIAKHLCTRIVEEADFLMTFFNWDKNVLIEEVAVGHDENKQFEITITNFPSSNNSIVTFEVWSTHLI